MNRHPEPSKGWARLPQSADSTSDRGFTLTRKAGLVLPLSEARPSPPEAKRLAPFRRDRFATESTTAGGGFFSNADLPRPMYYSCVARDNPSAA